MSDDVGNEYPIDRLSSERREVVVVGGGQAGLAIGYFLAQQGRDFVILEAADRTGRGVAGALGLAEAVHPGPVQQPSRARLPGRPRQLPGARTTWRPTSPTTSVTSTCRSSWAAGCVRSANPPTRTASSWTIGPTRPTRSWSPPARSRSRSCRPSPSASTPRSSSFTAPRTDPRRPSRRARCSSSAVATPAFRSPRSSRARTRSICRSARVRRRCRSASSAATCSGTSIRPGSSASRRSRGSADGLRGATRSSARALGRCGDATACSSTSGPSTPPGRR